MDEETSICPMDYDIVRVPMGSKDGRPTIDQLALCSYMSDLGVVYDGPVPYYFDGRTYVRVSDAFVERAVNEALEMYDPPLLIDRSTLWKVLFRIRNSCTADRVGEREPPDERYDAELTPFDNTLVDVMTGETVPFTRHRFITNRLAATWDPSVPDDHPVAAAYRSIIPDPDARWAFFEQVGYILFSRDFNPPAIFLTYGKAGTGKTALQKAVIAAIGEDNVSTLDIGQMSGRFGAAEMDGKLLNICGETGSGKRGDFVRADGELMKRLSDGQTVTVERKGRDPYQMRNTAKLWFITNTHPDFGDNSSGMTRRLRILRCNVPQDPTAELHKTMTEPTAVSWLVKRAAEAYRAFVKRGRVWLTPESMEIEKTAYDLRDSVRAFLNDFMETGERVRGRSVREVYDAYRSFCSEAGIAHPVTMMRFCEFVRVELDLDTTRENHMRELRFEWEEDPPEETEDSEPVPTPEEIRDADDLCMCLAFEGIGVGDVATTLLDDADRALLRRAGRLDDLDRILPVPRGRGA